MTIYTTLNKIRACKPCGLDKDSITGFRKLLNFLGKNTSDDEPLKFSTILESNGINDALWCLKSVYATNEKEIRLLAADVAERVLPSWEDWAEINSPKHLKAPRNCIEISRKYANGEASKEELRKARSEAVAAAVVVTAAKAAEWDAARYAARDAVFVVTVATDARGAVIDASGTIANDAEQKAQAELLIKYFG